MPSWYTTHTCCVVGKRCLVVTLSQGWPKDSGTLISPEIPRKSLHPHSTEHCMTTSILDRGCWTRMLGTAHRPAALPAAPPRL